MITLVSASNPVWVNAENTAIDVLAQFSHLPEPVPFTASLTDSEKHGREIFVRAAAGAFGPVAPYVPPPPPPSPTTDGQNSPQVIS